ncbi:MAG: Na(+)/H(+) antiporter subunit C, partial [Sphingomonas sp.]
MEANVTLILTAAAMIGCGVYLVLERSLTRVLIGLVLISNAANLLLLVTGGSAGQAPIVGEGPTAEMADPLPQALVLTAIVISLAMIAFVLAMAYRSWQLEGHDDVQDDVEDARIRRLAA